MKTINDIPISDNWEGVDASLEESLMEYRFLYNEKDNTGIFKVDIDNTILFTHGYISPREMNQIINESWFDKKSFFNFVGTDVEEWKTLNAVTRLHDLIAYYGVDNIIGSTYNASPLEDFKNLLSK